MFLLIKGWRSVTATLTCATATLPGEVAGGPPAIEAARRRRGNWTVTTRVTTMSLRAVKDGSLETDV